MEGFIRAMQSHRKLANSHISRIQCAITLKIEYEEGNGCKFNVVECKLRTQLRKSFFIPDKQVSGVRNIREMLNLAGNITPIQMELFR